MRRPRLEVTLLVVLALAVGAAVAWQGIAGRGTGRAASLEDVFAGADQTGLACLKDVVEESFADALVGRGEAPGRSLEEVARRVEEVRGLMFEEIPEPTYVSGEELSRRAAAFAQEYPEDVARYDEAVLSSVGAIEPGTDLREVAATALAEQVAGFYDTRTKELVVTGDPQIGLDPVQELTLAHELEHALADQALGLPIEERPEEGAEDAATAATALVEGDATLTMTLYSPEGSLTALVAASPSLAALAPATELPHYVQRGFLFPYAEGTGFVCHLYARGGWAAVDEAYADPPVTTAQILYPERYEGREDAVRPPERLELDTGHLSTWERVATRAWGAADLLFLFEAPGDDPHRALADPSGRASAWAGGELWLWEKEGRQATSIALVERAGSDGLCDSMRAWYLAAFSGDREVELAPGEAMAVRGEQQDAALRCVGEEIRLGIAPDLRTARALAA